MTDKAKLEELKDSNRKIGEEFIVITERQTKHIAMISKASDWIKAHGGDPEEIMNG